MFYIVISFKHTFIFLLYLLKVLHRTDGINTMNQSQYLPNSLNIYGMTVVFIVA